MGRKQGTAVDYRELYLQQRGSRSMSKTITSIQSRARADKLCKVGQAKCIAATEGESRKMPRYLLPTI